MKYFKKSKGTFMILLCFFFSTVIANAQDPVVSDRLLMAIGRDDRITTTSENLEKKRILHTLKPIACRQEQINSEIKYPILIEDGFNSPYLKEVSSSQRIFLGDFQLDHDRLGDEGFEKMKDGDCLSIFPITEPGSSQTLETELEEVNWFEKGARILTCVSFVLSFQNLLTGQKRGLDWLFLYGSGFGCLSESQKTIKAFYQLLEESPKLKKLSSALNWSREQAQSFLMSGTEIKDLFIQPSQNLIEKYKEFYPSCLVNEQDQDCLNAVSLEQYTTAFIFNGKKKPFSNQSSRPKNILHQTGGIITNSNMIRFFKDLQEELRIINKAITEIQKVRPPQNLANQNCPNFVLKKDFLSGDRLSFEKESIIENHQYVGAFPLPLLNHQRPFVLLPIQPPKDDSKKPFLYKRKKTIFLKLPERQRPYIWHLISPQNSFMAKNQNHEEIEVSKKDFFWVPDYVVQALPFQCLDDK
jgi:hypothetical protein